MLALLDLSLRQLVSRSRLAIILLLAAVPVGVSVIFRLADTRLEFGEAGNAFYDGLLVSSILPIVTMAVATAALGNELDDRTLSNLVLKPIPRWQIVLPKYLASLLVVAPLVVASGVGATVLSNPDFQAALAIGVALFAGVATYAAVFNWLGLVSKSALAFSLVYVFLWEGVALSFLDGVRYLSIRAYSLGIMHGMDEESFEVFEGRVIEFPAAVGGAVIVTIFFLWLTVRRLKRMDVP